MYLSRLKSFRGGVPLVFCVMLVCAAVFAQEVRCVVCGRPVAEGYTKDGKAYCSMKCLSTTFPKCVACGKPSPKGVLVDADPSKFICSDCEARPKCFCCNLPGDLRKLDDGRLLCSRCARTAVFDDAQALRIFDSVRDFLRERLKISSEHVIDVSLVGLDRLARLSGQGPGPGVELGLFEYTGVEETRVRRQFDSKGNLRETDEKKRRVDEKWSVYALYGLPADRLAEVFAHELAHDWMQSRCPQVSDPKLKEGWAEYIAWRYNDMLGRPALNRRIELNRDPVYGDGFRLIRDWAARYGYDGLKLKLRSAR